MSFHFGLLGLHFLSFWPFGPSFPFILAFWAFISFHFGLLGFRFFSFWLFGASFPYILAFWGFISFHFGLLNLHFFGFWPFGPSFPFILAFCAFISFHFGLLGFHSFILVFRHSILTGATSTKPPTGRPRSKPMGTNYMLPAAASKNRTEAQAHGPPNLEKIPQYRQRADQGPNLWATKPEENYMLIRQQYRKNRHRADQGPNPWATKPGENCTLTAAMATRPPTGRPKPNLDLAVDLLSDENNSLQCKAVHTGAKPRPRGFNTKVEP